MGDIMSDSELVTDNVTSAKDGLIMKPVPSWLTEISSSNDDVYLVVCSSKKVTMRLIDSCKRRGRVSESLGE